MKVSTYLNFNTSTEAAFNFYKSVFGGEFTGEIMRFGDIPPSDDMPRLTEAELQLVMHMMLELPGGHILMGSDAPESMGFKIKQGNSVYIMLAPATRKETKQLFDALSKDGVIEQDLQEMFWGDYYGSCRDKFGTQWMFNCEEKA